jgi:hypothetical protein
MNRREHDELRDLLRASLNPVKAELGRDLWPRMLRRLEAQPATKAWFAVLFSQAALASVPWFDWALLAVLVLAVCFFPRVIPIALYHL